MQPFAPLAQLHYSNYYIAETRTSRTIEILCCIKDHFLAMIQLIFRRCFSQPLTYTDKIHADYLEIYINQFNQEDNEALISSPIFSMLKENDDWCQGNKKGNLPLLDRMANDLKVNYFKLNKENKNEYSLRELMQQRNKTILSMLINVEGHWTTIHFDFKEKTLTYVDSMAQPNPFSLID